MNRTLFITIGIGALGLISGPYALQSAQMAQPPLDWSDLLIVFAGCGIGIFLVLGFQAFVRQFRGVRWGWWIFGANAAFFLGAGTSSLAIGLATGIEGAAPVLFLAIGLGISLALALCRVFFRSAFAT